MSIVTIAENLGSQVDEVGRGQRALGWEFADREIIAKAAEGYGEGVTELRHVTEEKPTLWERFARFLYHVDLDDPLLYGLCLNTERVAVADA